MKNSLEKHISLKEQLKGPNFLGDNGQLFLVRCYNCAEGNGRENWGPVVATGHCAWCGWADEGETDDE